MRDRIPGIIATTLLVVTTALWTFWGTAEMYYEGWGNPFPVPLAYLIPAAICLLLSLAAVAFPLVGGVLLIVVGGAFTIWWVNLTLSRGGDLLALLSLFPVSGMLVLTGVLFLLESRSRKRRRQTGWRPQGAWWRRNFRYLAVAGVPLAVLLAVSAANLPGILLRVDDGDRGARVITGNGVTLMWAPAGPGWNWKQPWGGYPSWDAIALYGVEPIGIDVDKPGYDDIGRSATAADMAATGLCRYLSADGLRLTDEPQDIWRMPTADEIVRSLPRRGANAGCTWDGESRRATCAAQPDKETPLWAPDQAPIYMWAADEVDAEEARYVSYNGWINAQPKRWGNPRHGYRCVRGRP
ncbi:MAG: hypothetical protein PVJ49_14505 [Acidobacteriota bacterium]|jgi:hypothetical protein